MNIWILNHHAGDSGRHPTLAKELAEKEHNVQLFSSSFLHNTFEESINYKNNEFYQEKETNNYRRIFIKTPKYYSNGFRRLINQLSFSYRAYQVGRKKLKEESTPEVIIGSSVHLFTGLTAFFLAKKANAKFVFEVRDIWPQTLVDLGALKENSIVTKVFKYIESFLYKKADLIISLLPNADEHIVKYGVSRDKISYVPNGLDVKAFNESIKNEQLNKQLKDYFNENKENLILTYTGAHGVANGLDTIINTANLLKKHKSIKFLLVGDGPEKNALIKLSRQYKLDNVTFISRVEKNQVAKILENSDVCLFHLKDTPVFKYGLSSNKLFDYMYSGRPMIFAVNTSYNFAEESQSGIQISPESPKEMANTILELSEMPMSKLTEMGKSGKEFVLENHDYRILAERLIKCLE